MADNDSSNSFMWFLAGLGFGALLGVLYAPRSGRETRQAIRNTAQEGAEFIKKQGREARETMGEWVDRGKEVINRQKDSLSAAYRAGVQTYQEERASEGQKKS